MSTAIDQLALITDPLQQQPIGIWAYLLLAVLVAVEGPITTLAGAVAASSGLLNPILVFVFASLGNLTADTLWYAIGYFGKIEWLMHYGSRLGVTGNFISRLQKDIHVHIHKLLFVAKLTLGFVIPTLVAAGLARVPFKRWFGVLFTAECIWTGTLVAVGYYFGYLTQHIESSLRWVSVGGAIIFISVIALYLSHRKPDLEGKP